MGISTQFLDEARTKLNLESELELARWKRKKKVLRQVVRVIIDKAIWKSIVCGRHSEILVVLL